MIEKREVTVIGTGKVGQSFAQLLRHNGHSVRLIGRDKRQQIEKSADADIVLITVTDRQIAAVCDSIANHLPSEAVVAHCSGALGSDALSSASQRGCSVASIHPLNTFPSLRSALKLFHDNHHHTYLYCEGDSPALDQLLPIAESLGFIPVVIDSSAKTRYHAACVFACNYLTTLIELSLTTAEQAGLDRHQFWRAIQPLIQSTLTNIDEYGTAAALSGPIARGDTSIVEQHLAQLTDTKRQYTELAVATLYLAEENGELSQAQIAKLREILEVYNPR